MEQKKEIIKSWESNGKKCVILWVRDHYSAYIETDLDISYSDGVGGYGDYETSPSYFISVHGGLTFSGELEITPFDKDIIYFGWDYAHLGDHMGSKDMECFSCKRGSCKKWTKEEVEADVEKAVSELIDYEKLYPKMKILNEEYKIKLKKLT